MAKKDFVVAIYPPHTAAEAGVKELKQSGFDILHHQTQRRARTELNYENEHTCT